MAGSWNDAARGGVEAEYLQKDQGTATSPPEQAESDSINSVLDAGLRRHDGVRTVPEPLPKVRTAQKCL
jgi:hypothetical protein